MPDYKKMYFHLAAKIADVIELLIEAQQTGEDIYIENDDSIIVVPPNISDNKDSTESK